ncbi:hypothetical protein J1614_000424 [Plenodomus biglobosus]|nr:hypothetical protein J1614_000424 [Plenodomus biglobosus]
MARAKAARNANKAQTNATYAKAQASSKPPTEDPATSRPSKRIEGSPEQASHVHFCTFTLALVFHGRKEMLCTATPPARRLVQHGLGLLGPVLPPRRDVMLGGSIPPGFKYDQTTHQIKIATMKLTITRPSLFPLSALYFPCFPHHGPW